MNAFVTPAPIPLVAPATIIVLRFVCIVFGDSLSLRRSCLHYDRGNGVAVAKSLKTRCPARRSIITCPQCESVVRRDYPESENTAVGEIRPNMLERTASVRFHAPGPLG